jgi:hypothetical protein
MGATTMATAIMMQRPGNAILMEHRNPRHKIAMMGERRIAV